MEFLFAIDDKLNAIIAHTKAHAEAGLFYGNTIGPSLFLVKDDGV